MSDPGARKLVIWPEGADLMPVKEAFMTLSLPYKVQPFWFSAEYNDDERVLVLADGFDYSTIVDRIYPKKLSLLPDAILWCLGEKELDRGPSYAEDVMERLLGAKLVDILHEPDEQPGEGESW